MPTSEQAQLVFEILAKLNDQATAGLKQVETAVKGLAQVTGTDARKNFETLSTTLERTGRVTRDVGDDTRRFGSRVAEGTSAVRFMGARLVSELNPSLGKSALTFGTATRAATGLGVAVGGLVTGLAVVVAVVQQQVSAVKELTERQAVLNLAVKSFDAETIRSQLGAAAKDLETMEERSKTWTGTLLNVFRKFGDAVAFTTAATTNLTMALEALARVTPTERELKLAEVYGKQAVAIQGLNAAFAARAAQEQNLPAFERAHRAMAHALSDEAAQAQKILRLQAQAEIGAAEVRKEPPEVIAAIKARLREGIETLGIQTLAKFEALQTARKTGGLGIEQTFLGIARQRAQVLTTVAGLSPEERAWLQLEVVEAEKVAKVSAARGVTAQEELARLEAQVKSFNIVLVELERVDPLAGLAKGFRESAEEFGAAGLRMQEIARGTATNLQRAFSDQFFAVITGAFKKDIAKQFGLAMVRTITDELAKLAAAPLLRGLA